MSDKGSGNFNVKIINVPYGDLREGELHFSDHLTYCTKGPMRAHRVHPNGFEDHVDIDRGEFLFVERDVKHWMEALDPRGAQFGCIYNMVDAIAQGATAENYASDRPEGE